MIVELARGGAEPLGCDSIPWPLGTAGKLLGKDSWGLWKIGEKPKRDRDIPIDAAANQRKIPTAMGQGAEQ